MREINQPGWDKLQPLMEELRVLLDDPRSGLKESSDTNKTRYGIYALLEEAYKMGLGNE